MRGSHINRKCCNSFYLLTLFLVIYALTLGGCSQQFVNLSIINIGKNSDEKKLGTPITTSKSYDAEQNYINFVEEEIDENIFSHTEINSSGFPVSSKAINYLPFIKKYSERYGLDWLLVYAVIEKESRFKHNVVSYRGAYGLMQIMPIAQIEVTEKLGMEELYTPRNNIKGGVFYLKSLYNIFNGNSREDRIALTLAAYNAGIGRVLDAQRIALYLGNDPNKWESVREALKYMSKRYYTLHNAIWDSGYPPSGYFRNPQTTIDYVEDIMQAYDDYSLSYVEQSPLDINN